MSKLPKEFTVICLTGVDRSMSAANCVEVYQIVGDGVPLFNIRFDYWATDSMGDYDVNVRSLTEDIKPYDLPFISDGIDLIRTFYTFLQEEQCKIEGEFVDDAFSDQETGEPLALPIDFYAFAVGHKLMVAET